MRFDVNKIRQDFPALEHKVCGKPFIYLDNAATAQMPRQVLDAVWELEAWRGNVHRGIHTVSENCTAAYENARKTCAAFLGAKPAQIVFTSGATDGINRIANVFPQIYAGGVVTTALEHHSNYVPWQQMCQHEHRTFQVLRTLPDGTLNLETLGQLLDRDISLLAVSQCSNVLGMMNPISEICEFAHKRGIHVLVDGAQSACHEKIDVSAMGCDYFVLSGHKLGAPFGIGLLYCKTPIPPTVFGGGMVDRVTEAETTFDVFPLSMEAGTPNVSGAVGLAAAITYRNQLPDGWMEHERTLIALAEGQLSMMPEIKILGTPPHVGCLSFTIDGVQPFDAAVLLDKLGIALRSGHHCAAPLLNSMGLEYTLRISPSFYNTAEEIDTFCTGLQRVIPMLKR